MPTSNRRALHQPFLTLSSISPPTQPPSFPKYPFSSTNSRPFFPIYPSPPPPPPSSIPTFPANISSLVSPSQSTLPSSSKLLLAIALPLLSLALLFLTLAFFFFHHCRRRKRSSVKNDFGSDSHHLFPPNSTASDRRKLSDTSAPASSEFLYLGTLVNSRGHVADESSGACVGPPSAGSPELRPLPPLARQVPRNGEGGYSSEEEFYSPRDFPSGEKRSPGGPASSSRREKCGSQSPVSTLRTPLFPSSKTASSPSGSSPTALIKSPSFRTNSVAAGDIGFKPPPPPKPMLRPRTPSPPKRKPPSPSPPNSPPEKRSDFSSQTLRSPRRIGDFPRNPFANGPPQIQPPPPPSPLPPVGYWESHPSKFLAGQPPVLVPPKPIGLKNSTAAVFPAESPENSDAGEKGEEHPRPKLKPLHWDKVRASSDRAMVWDHLKSSSFQLNEEMIETLFVCDSAKATSEVGTRRQVLPAPIQEYMVLDPKKSQNIAILLRALNVTKEEVCEALLEGNTDSLGNELLETLLKMAPSKEEEIKLKEYKDDSPFKLGPAEKFLKSMLDIPFTFKRVDAMLYIANFDSEVIYLKKSFETLELACEELRSSRLFRKLLDAVLKAGNRMNVGTNRGDAQAFKLNTLLKLIDIKSTDSKTTLLHFVVQEISRAEGSRLSAANPSSVKPQTNTLRDDLECKMLGLQVVSGLGAELSNVKKAGIMDSEILSSYVSELAGGMGKIREVVRLNEVLSLVNSSLQFHEAMSGFLRMAEGEITKLQAQESIALSAVKEITEYFHGDLAKEEAHPFRIFMVVKDFLSFLDQVCKEVGRINEHSVVSSARQFPVLASTGVPQDSCYEAWEY